MIGKVFKVIRFILRFILLLAAAYLAVECAEFFYNFRLLSVDDFGMIVNFVTVHPLESCLFFVTILLFLLSLLGQIMLLQYQIWRFPLSIFAGYAAGIFITRWLYYAQPFEENTFQLNSHFWYYPLLIATLLLLRSVIGFKLPKKKLKDPS